MVAMTPLRPELMEELVEEVLLRFPSDDPASLVSAAIVCKLWCRLISSTSFRRRFREFHHRRAPLLHRFHEVSRRAVPLLGVICTGSCKIRHDVDMARNNDPSNKPVRVVSPPTACFVPTTSSHFVDAPDGRAIDARHSRVLLYRVNVWHHTITYSVWDPVTRQQRDLPELPWCCMHDYSRAVVCAASAGGGNCDHVDCLWGPFLVVVMDIQWLVVNLSVYSSEDGGWSHLPGFKLPLPRRLGGFWCRPIVVVGSVLYLLLPLYDEILKFDLATLEVSAIPLPSKIRHLKLSIVLTDDDGEIGFVVEERFLFATARGERNMPGKEAIASTTTDNDGIPTSQPKGSTNPVQELLAQCDKSESIV